MCCTLLSTQMQHIRDIVDPEHPYTLEQLNVVTEEQVEVDDAAGTVQVRLGGLERPARCRRSWGGLERATVSWSGLG